MGAMTRWLVGAGWAAAIAALAGLYASVCARLFLLDEIAPSTTFVIEHAVAGMHAHDPLQGLALVYPPVPILIYAALGHPAFATAAVATLATLALLWFVFHRSGDIVTALLACVALLSPAITVDALGAAPFWAFAAIVAWALYMACRYIDKEYSLYVFQAGLLIAFAYFIDVRIALIALALGGSILLLLARRELRRGICVAIVLLFPIVYFTLSWGFVQWIFTGHPWMALPPLGSRGITSAYPIVLLYLFAIGCVAVAPKSRYPRLHVAIFLGIPVAAALGLWIGRGFSGGEIALLGLACTLTALTQIGNTWLRRIAALAAAAASISLAFTLPALPPHAIVSLAPPATYAADLGHPAWEHVADIARYIIAIGLAVGIALLARHSLRRLTGRTI